MRLVLDAYDRLLAVPAGKAAYLESDIDGVGKNFIRDETRRKAIEVYGQALTRYALRLLLSEAEGPLTIPGSAEDRAHQLRRPLPAQGTGFRRSADAASARDRAAERPAGAGEQAARR